MSRPKKTTSNKMILPPVVFGHSATIAILEAIVPLCRFPDPKVVELLGGHQVFNTIRVGGKKSDSTSKSPKRFDPVDLPSGVRAMYDDNTTPRYAFLLSHGQRRTSHPEYMDPDGVKRTHYVFAHVWEASQDINAYTNVANLVAVPKYASSLTDGNGPLAPYFQHHAYSVYGWKPEAKQIPLEPKDYEVFRDLVVYVTTSVSGDPRELVKRRCNELDNQWTRTLKDNGIFPWP